LRGDMSEVFGRYGPAHPSLGRLGFKVTRPFATALFAAGRFYGKGGRYARERLASMQAKLRAGQDVYLMGITPSGHNSGAALIEVSSRRGIRLLCNEEEERYTGIKHYDGYPEQSVESLRRRVGDMGLRVSDIHACLAGWNYVDFMASGVRSILDHAPLSFALLLPSSAPKFNVTHVWRARKAPRRLGRQLGLPGAMPIIALRHHDNHASFSYAVSAFTGSKEPVMVTVLDGYGDDAAISLYVAEDDKLKRLRSNESQNDSLGLLYGVLSSTQGGWPALSSEGRYMGASAWGNNDRLTNPIYPQLRQLIHFGSEGQIHVNRAMANWHIWGDLRPYKPSLREILGPPVAHKDRWNPDAVLQVEDIKHPEITQARLDGAAAAQLLFEDALFHVIGYLIRTTGSHRLVMTGGTALNCIANMRLLEHFDTGFFQRNLGKRARLHLWVPPTPGDAGIALGAACNFALSGGVPPGEKLRHAFYCGTPPTTASIRGAVRETAEIACLELGNVSDTEELRQTADLAAYVVSRDGVLGLFHGVAETGPRALGHRSIVANPCNPKTLENINKLVKFRERIRPLAPMATLEAAHRFFELSPGASDDDYNAYNYMVLTARARPESYDRIPAVVHRDGTSRVQIVREDLDPFTFAYLKALGRRLGVEVSVNTSLNVASPIVQTPIQALGALKRSRAMSGIIMISGEGDAFLVWHDVAIPPKDGGRCLRDWYGNWKVETGSRALV
jgi:carbamoyltransferase